MAPLDLPATVRDVSGLRALFVAALPDAVLLTAWVDEAETWEVGDTALEIGELVAAAHGALRSLDALPSTLQLTLEAAEVQLVTRHLDGDVVAVFVFHSDVQLGLVRVHVDQIADALRGGLLAAMGWQ